MSKQTTAINTPFARPDAYGSLAMPIYTNVSFEFQDAQEMADVFCNRVKAPDYARIANPTVDKGRLTDTLVFLVHLWLSVVNHAPAPLHEHQEFQYQGLEQQSYNIMLEAAFTVLLLDHH